jgi:selenocysteine lyase/cysteine desulfurase
VDKAAWRDIRGAFRLDPDVLHFGAFWLSSCPAPVREAIDSHRLGIDRNPVHYVLDNEEHFERSARMALADYVGGDQDRVVLAESTTEALMLSIGGLSILPSDEILTTEHEHYSAYSAAARLSEMTGAGMRVVALYDQPGAATADQMLYRLARAIRPETRVIVVTWVHSGSGVRIPIEAIAGHVAEANSSRPPDARMLLCVDATHGFGLLRIDLQETPCDIFASSCHKWLNGPHGTGFAHFSAHAAALAQWLIPSFAPGPLGRFTGRLPETEGTWERLTPGGFHAFENRWSIPAATAFASSIGQEAIEDRVCSLADRLKTGIAVIEGLRLVTPISRQVSAGIVCFELDGLDPTEVVSGLRERAVVASVSPYKVPYARLTPSIYNSEPEIDELIERLKDLARNR